MFIKKKLLVNPYSFGGFMQQGGASTVGTVAGTAIGGPVGGMIGGALGSVVGGLFGKDEPEPPKQIVNVSSGKDDFNFDVNKPINPVSQGWAAYGGFINKKLADGGMINHSLNSEYGSEGMINPTKVNYFGNGGLHETNPHGGIPLGINEEGGLNTVEEGEVSVEIDRNNKYIFSNRLMFE